ncbi:MAG: sodium/solute symporter [Pirellulales bacterium]|nr:sodium/solute symporter [Pirellulales bacterium]
MFGFHPLLAATDVVVLRTEAAITWIDWTVVAFYICGVVGIGLWVGLRRKSAEGAGYFLAEKSLTWPVIGLALFSTNISTIHLVGLAESGYTSGLAFGNFEWMAAFTLIILALFFAPFYLRSKVTTLPDFLEKRYCRPCRDWLAAISILSAVFIHLGFTLFTGVVVLEGFLLNDLVADPAAWRWVTLLVLGGIAGLYTIVGGLMAVVLTESLDTIVLLIGAICITVVGLYAVGGWDGLETAMAELAEAKHASATTQEAVEPLDKALKGDATPTEEDGKAGNSAGTVRIKPEHIPGNVENHLSILRAHGDQSDLPWYAVLLGYPVIGVWYWCTDQTIVQRVLGAKDENHARVGPLFAGFIKILPVFIFVLPGIVCLALIHQGQLGELPTVLDEVTGRQIPNTKETLVTLIKGLLPTGLKGLMAAALLAALMSTVSGALNSIATLFSYDLYRRWRPETSDKKLVLIGRIATGCAMVAAIAWSPLIANFRGIFEGISTMISFVAPPITVLFLWGVFWRKANGTGALITAWYGTLLGFICFLLTFCKVIAGWTETIGFGLPFLMSSFYLLITCSIVLVVSSYSRRLTIWISAVGTILGVTAAIAIWAGALNLLLVENLNYVTQLSTNPDARQFVYPGWLPWILVPGFLYGASSPLLLVITLLVSDQPESPEKNDLVWKSFLEPLRGESWRGIGNFRILTVVLFVTMIVFYWLFS